MYDLCATLPDDSILCDSLEEYVLACIDSGVWLGSWRSEVAQCGMSL